ncbi:MAG: hypothetical protein IKS87_08645 [Lachnospiraceae bacterium]|nr:hypothetical protein [Lachnospiraceae bacterium]
MVYQPPEGFTYDPRSGLWSKRVLGTDAQGRRVEVVTFFNADTGEYRQSVLPAGTRQAAPKSPARRQSNPTPRSQAAPGTKLSPVIFIAAGAAVVVLALIITGVVVAAKKIDPDKLKTGGTSYLKEALFGGEEEDGETDADPADRAEDAAKDTDVNASAPDEPAEMSVGRRREEAAPTQAPEKEENKAADLFGGLNDTVPQEEYGTDYVEGAEDFVEGQYLGMFIDADVDIPRAFAPVLVFKENYEFEMMLNFGEGTNTYYGQYYVESNAATGETYIHLHDYGTENGIPSTAVVLFTDNDFDYCRFLDEGFGLMGYSGAPYGFYRDMR